MLSAASGPESEWIATWHAGESNTYYRTTMKGMMPSVSGNTILAEFEERYYNGSWSATTYPKAALDADGNLIGGGSASSTFDRDSYNNYTARHGHDPNGEIIYSSRDDDNPARHFVYDFNGSISGTGYTKSQTNTHLNSRTDAFNSNRRPVHTAVGGDHMYICGQEPTGTYRGGGHVFQKLTTSGIGSYVSVCNVNERSRTMSSAYYGGGTNDEFITMGLDDSRSYNMYFRHFDVTGSLKKGLRFGPTYTNTGTESRIVQDPSDPDLFWFAFAESTYRLHIWCYNASSKSFVTKKKYSYTSGKYIRASNEALQIGVDKDYIYVATIQGTGGSDTATGLIYRQDKNFSSAATRLKITGNDNDWSSNYGFYMHVSPTGMIYYGYSTDIPGNTSWYAHVLKAKWDTMVNMSGSDWQGGGANNGTITVATDTDTATTDTSLTVAIDTSAFSAAPQAGVNSTPVYQDVLNASSGGLAVDIFNTLP